MEQIIIREDIPKYMQELKAWLAENARAPLEEMDGFFASRAEIYEEHMAVWQPAYDYAAGLIPPAAETLLDIGCGTGLELAGIFSRQPHIRVTGVDLSRTMLDKLQAKYRHRAIELVCADYFQADFGESRFDAAISFETLHHFAPEKKQLLFDKLRRALKPGGVYIHADYLACCPEEEELLFSACAEKRRKAGIPEDVFVHFDTPLTLEHETELLRRAGFHDVRLLCCINGAYILRMQK